MVTVDLAPEFGTEVIGFEPSLLSDPGVCGVLQDLFDRRSILVFRDLDISHPEQLALCRRLAAGSDGERDDEPDDGPVVDDNFYISNKRPRSAAPFGRLQFHSDTMWSSGPFEVLSLYGVDVEEPAVPTTFVSATRAWATLPTALRDRAGSLEVLHTAGEVTRGDLTDVIVTTVDRPPTTVTKIGHRHPRTGDTILYICEQMTREVVGMDPAPSEALLGELFDHMYAPAHRLHHHWRNRDLVVWDNLATQHARPNVDPDGPARTLRKVATPMPKLDRSQLPSFSARA